MYKKNFDYHVLKIDTIITPSSQVGLVVKNQPVSAGDIKRCRFNPWVGKIPWRRAWQPTPVFWPGEFHGQRSLACFRPWGHKESNMTEATEHTYFRFGDETLYQSHVQKYEYKDPAP